MAKNEIFKYSDWISLPVLADTPSGSPITVGGLVGVAQTNEGEGGNDDGFASVALTGAFEVETADAVANIGDPVYIDAADYSISATGTGNLLFGHALTTKGAGAGTVTVRIADHHHGVEA